MPSFARTLMIVLLTSVLASAVLPESAKAGIWRVVPVSVGGTELPPTSNERFVRH